MASIYGCVHLKHRLAVFQKNFNKKKGIVFQLQVSAHHQYVHKSDEKRH